ncbi:MAG: hypothetical protein HY294_06130 [Candidatus Rokubacteria bacterium]|nr:hypothetical protein [Candidatus Rokubacteria bacterium]
MRPLRDQRGVVLPLTLVALAIILALTVTFSSYAALEPTIASNLQASMLAHSAADAGFERAIWALSHCAPTGPCADSNTMIRNDLIAAVAASPYDGATNFAFNNTATFSIKAWQQGVQGGNPADPGNMYQLQVVGQAAAVSGQGAQMANPRFSQRKILARVQYLRALSFPAAAAGVYTGDAQKAGGANGTVSAAPATANCVTNTNPKQWGILITQPSVATGPQLGKLNASGNVSDINADNSTSAQTLAAINGQWQTQPNETWLYTQNEWGLLRTLAQNGFGTYIRPNTANWPLTSGRLVLNTSLPIPNGLVFIDSPGTGIPAEVTGQAVDQAKVTMDQHPNWSGWLIVNGELIVQNSGGTTTLSGLVYTAKSLRLSGGATVAGNVVAGGGPYIDMSTVNMTNNQTSYDQLGLELYGGNTTYDCPKSRTGSNTAVPQQWFLVPGTYQEVASP